MGARGGIYAAIRIFTLTISDGRIPGFTKFCKGSVLSKRFKVSFQGLTFNPPEFPAAGLGRV